MQNAAHAQQLNASHIINKLQFGPQPYPGQIQPLNGASRIDRKATGIDKYFIKVIPTEYKNTWGWVTETYQYSVTEYYSPLPEDSRAMPGIYILYDTWPIQVNIHAMRLGVLHMLVRTCAVCGGVWAVTGLMDRMVHEGVVAMKRIARAGVAP